MRITRDLALQLLALGFTVLGTTILEILKIKKVNEITVNIQDKVAQEVMKALKAGEAV